MRPLSRTGDGREVRLDIRDSHGCVNLRLVQTGAGLRLHLFTFLAGVQRHGDHSRCRAEVELGRLEAARLAREQRGQDDRQRGDPRGVRCRQR
jgi:hypothetical protein